MTSRLVARAVILFLLATNAGAARRQSRLHRHRTHALKDSREQNNRRLELLLDNPISAFDEWMLQFNRSYAKGSPEWRQRYEIWVTNLYHVVEYNKKQSSHWLTMTPFADMKPTEVKEQFLGLTKKVPNADLRTVDENSLESLSGVPDHVDWRTRGAVTKVKDQRRCRACWAFSAVGGIEGMHAIATGSLVDLSEQELVDCDSYDRGCEGGYMETAFKWVVENGGITTDSDYEYEAVNGSCEAEKESHHEVRIAGFENVAPGEASLVRAIAEQPVSVAIKAGLLELALYGGGVFDAECGVEVDHAALAIGYDLEERYVLVKNSWGIYWGEDGYVRLALNKNDGQGQCGVALFASYPVAIEGPPRPQEQPRPGVQCGIRAFCSAGETCCCKQRVWKMCFQWSCCPAASAVCCKNSKFCCPAHHPICVMSKGLCSDGESTISALEKSSSRPGERPFLQKAT